MVKNLFINGILLFFPCYSYFFYGVIIMKIKSLSPILSVLSASFPFASNFLQLRSEVSGYKIEKRLQALEDPISALHNTVPDLSKLLYQAIKSDSANSRWLDKSDLNLDCYRKAILLLHSHGYLEDKGYVIEFNAPSYVLYMATLSEKDNIIIELNGYMDSCESGCSIYASDLANSLNLPLALVLSVFEIYESKGYGYYDRTIDYEAYLGK